MKQIVPHDVIYSEAIEQAGYVVLISDMNPKYGFIIHPATGRIFELSNDDDPIISHEIVLEIVEWSKQ